MFDVRIRTCERNRHIDVMYADDRHGMYIRVQVWIHFFGFRTWYCMYVPIG